jgi:PleD family two-component response regulator
VSDLYLYILKKSIDLKQKNFFYNKDKNIVMAKVSKRILDDSQNSRINILVAEDDNFQRLALIDILTLCQYDVTAVENGRIARDELLKENAQYDLVLLDLMMPGEINN